MGFQARQKTSIPLLQAVVALCCLIMALKDDGVRGGEVVLTFSSNGHFQKALGTPPDQPMLCIIYNIIYNIYILCLTTYHSIHPVSFSHSHSFHIRTPLPHSARIHISRTLHYIIMSRTIRSFDHSFDLIHVLHAGSASISRLRTRKGNKATSRAKS